MDESSRGMVERDDVEETLLRFVADEVAADGADLRADEKLVESGRIDSLGLVYILSFIDEHYHVDLVAAAEPRDLESVRALAMAIRREMAGRENAIHAA